VLDLKQKKAVEVLHKLLETADVFMANIRPAALERLGLGTEALHARHKNLIVCNLVGFGRGGRYADRPAYDSIIQGMSGITACNARIFGEPKFVPTVMMDHTVGLIATQCVLAALFHREKTGEAQAIEVPVFENAASFVLVEHMGDHTFLPPLGDWGDRRVLDKLAQPIATKDGWICVSANTDQQAFALFDAIGRPELKRDPKFNSVKARYANIREYFSIRAEGLKQKTTAEWLDILERADVPAGPVHSIDTLTGDEHLADVGFFRKVEHPVEGPNTSSTIPISFPQGCAMSRPSHHTSAAIASRSFRNSAT
jgi:crotonobetainyl-CoA:carnitine CoA-transferase CaiB-like acyl-CoA transferase